MSRVLAKRALLCHPDCKCAPYIQGVGVKVTFSAPHILLLEYVVIGDAHKLKVPQLHAPERANNLWQTTCFELFIKTKRTGYAEFNFSPSGQWAAYQFEDYREGMRALQVTPPVIETCVGDKRLAVNVTLDLGTVLPNPPWQIALSAVIEETDSTKSYWALCHPLGPPDFHHADCFALTLTASGTS